MHSCRAAPNAQREALHSPQFVAARDDLVGRAPWPAADPLVGLLARRKSRTRGSGADEGVHPTFLVAATLLCRQAGRLPSLAFRAAEGGESCSASGPNRAPVCHSIYWHRF